jgi:predicted Zn finger-like uncharacterized protein
MIVTCPACAVRYVVDPAALGAKGRTVRCARCAETWFQAPPPGAEPAAVIEPVMTPPPTADGSPAIPTEPMPSFIGTRTLLATPNLPALRKPPPLVSPVQLGWAALGGFVVLFLAGLLLLRTEITTVWPATRRLYSLIGAGLPGIDDWLKLRDTHMAYDTVDGQPRVTVSGEIVNVSAVPRPVPKLRVTLLNSKDEIVKSWICQPDGEPLQPGQSVALTTMSEAPSGEVTALSVTWIVE